MLSAVLAVHKHGYAHRDLNFENFLVDADFNIKLANFGMAAPLKGWDSSGILRS